MRLQTPLWGRTDDASTPTLLRGDSLLVTNWVNGTWRVDLAKYKGRIGAIHNNLEIAYRQGMTPANFGYNFAHHAFREFNKRADELTHRAREGHEGL